MAHIFFDRKPVLETAGQCHFIGIFQLAAKGNTPGNGGYADGEWLQFFLYIVDGGVALYVGIECKNEFPGFFLLNPLDKGFDI